MLARWPASRPLAVLWSGDHAPEPWTVLAVPSADVVAGSASSPLPAVAGPDRATPVVTGLPRFAGGWIGYLSYDLGAEFEPRARVRSAPHSRWPVSWWRRCDSALAFDHQRGRWWSIGGCPLPEPTLPAGQEARPFRLGALRSRSGRAGYTRAVARALGYIRAGDAYQINLAHQLRARFGGSTRALFAALVRRAQPWLGAYIEGVPGGGALLSLSPELFLDFDPVTRRVVTRPMKGTRPAGTPVRELRDSSKDRAELAMIVDLMRNDLGRVCEFGSVRVETPRAIEHHGGASGVVQATATVSGTLRRAASLQDLVRATFPGGSVTGAPKIRAMQIIHELEPCPRGPYCGAIGCLSDTGHLTLNIAIRTALVEGTPGARPGEFDDATLRYSVGAGIVADSLPESEWQETLDKARHIAALAGDRRPGPLEPAR